jgi:hypothetical protein
MNFWMDMEQMASFGDHDVVVMAISYTKQICGHAAACARMQETISGLSIFIVCEQGITVLSFHYKLKSFL